MWNTISFYSSGNKVSMKWVNDKDLDKFIEFVNKNVEGSNNSLGLIDQANKWIKDQVEWNKQNETRKQKLQDEYFLQWLLN